MASRIMQVFYGNDFLPYKDKERTVHYPIVGNSFTGASKVNQIHFYIGDIGGTNNVTWVANVKLPNGRILYQILSNIELDSEINEYYVTFDLSSYYTQLKGDIYISLNGCNGEVTIETDDETDITTIDGTIENSTVVVTGAIKLSINYAPQRPLGFSFDIDQYQDIVNALSDKANIFNTVQVINDISQADLTNYNHGQLFYDLATKTYYQRNTFSLVGYIKADFGLLGQKHTILRLQEGSDTSFIAMNVSQLQNRLLIVTYGGVDYLFQYSYDGGITAGAMCLQTKEYWYSSSLTALQGFSDLIVDANKITYVQTTNSENVVYATNDSGQNTEVVYGYNLEGGAIVQRDSNSQINVPLTPTSTNHATSKKYVDDIVASIKQNAFVVVDTSEYPTLKDFLDNYQGEEGYIYLYPINPYPSYGYYQYIWEQGDWLDIGTTQIDLSDYYTKSEVDTSLATKVDKTTSNRIVYGTDGNHQQTTISYNTSGVPNTLVLRNSSGVILGYTTTNYVDTNLATKVDKTSSGEKVYGTSELGEQMTYDVDSDLVGSGAIVRRETSTGTVVVGAPTSNTHATTKKYVDDSIASAISSVFKYKGTKTVAEINALTNIQVGDVYNVSDSGTLSAGNVQVRAGDNVAWTGTAWDKLAEDIDWTAYDEKFIAAGFFEVQNYNENSGEITFVYSTELYDMSYDSDTGVMTIEAN